MRDACRKRACRTITVCVCVCVFQKTISGNANIESEREAKGANEGVAQIAANGRERVSRERAGNSPPPTT